MCVHLQQPSAAQLQRIRWSIIIWWGYGCYEAAERKLIRHWTWKQCIDCAHFILATEDRSLCEAQNMQFKAQEAGRRKKKLTNRVDTPWLALSQVAEQKRIYVL